MEENGIIVNVNCKGKSQKVRIKSPETKSVDMFIKDMTKLFGLPVADNNQVPYEFHIGRKNEVPFNDPRNKKGGKTLMKDFNLVPEEELIFFPTTFVG